MDKETEKKAGALFSGGPVNRRDTWPSKEDAYRNLKTRGIWKTFDDRVLRINVVRACGFRYEELTQCPLRLGNSLTINRGGTVEWE
ncbi:hypothetical protein BKA70DRAFT_1271530 [Coprinopsis sp. MPI-PUGE-AT-0042]|nr:hypothetical protein BKA70DRAFT_1271530 [Coprinopsis sp. MPI-PUGE-AT-0042]